VSLAAVRHVIDIDTDIGDFLVLVGNNKKPTTLKSCSSM
jgi:hypothetical protein